MTVHALHSIRLNVAHFDLALQFYSALGMVEDLGLRRADSPTGATSVIADNDPGAARARSVALRWPSDPFMHLVLAELPHPRPEHTWPVVAAQSGLTTLGLRVRELEAAVERVVQLGGSVVVAAGSTDRMQGTTRSAFVRDVSTNLVELVEMDPSRTWDLSGCQAYQAEVTFLHVHLNSPDLVTTAAFYEGLGFEHNGLNDFRPNAVYDYQEGEDPFLDLWGRPLDGLVEGMRFLRLPSDPSRMHLEILGVQRNALKPRSDTRGWLRPGFIRPCFLARGMNTYLADLRRRGARVSPRNDRAALGWGDAEWAYFADPEDNIATLEEWFATGHWGESF